MALTLDDLKPGSYSVVSSSPDASEGKALTLDDVKDYKVVSPGKGDVDMSQFQVPPERPIAAPTGPNMGAEDVRAAAQPAPVPQGPEVGSGEAFARGAKQGATMGFGDEAQAGAQTGLHRFGEWVASMFGLSPNGQPKTNADWQAEFRAKRDDIRAADANAERQHPLAFGAGDILGTTGATALTGAGLSGAGAKALGGALAAPATLGEAVAGGALTGAARGAGDAKELADVPGEALKGAAVGEVAGAVGHGASKVIGSAAEKRVAQNLAGEPGSAIGLKEIASRLPGGGAAVAGVFGLPRLLEKAGMDKEDADTVGAAVGVLGTVGGGRALSKATSRAADAVANALAKHPGAARAIISRYGPEVGQRILDLATNR